MDMKNHLSHVDLEKLGKILEIKEAYQRAQIVAQIEYFGSFDRLWRCSEEGLSTKRKVP